MHTQSSFWALLIPLPNIPCGFRTRTLHKSDFRDTKAVNHFVKGRGPTCHSEFVRLRSLALKCGLYQVLVISLFN